MNEHPSYLVYQHIGPFLKSRGLETSAPLDVDRARFIAGLDQIGYFRLDAEDSDHRTVSILLLALQGKFTDHGPHLRGLVLSLNSEAFAREGRLSEVVVIVPEDIMGKKNMTDVIKDFQQVENVTYNMHPYRVFSLDIPRAQCVPRHEMVSADDVRSFLTRERLALQDLKKIAASNAPVIWIGGRPGDVVRICTASETAGEAYDYCFVI